VTRVIVWNEFRQERSHDEVRALYPDGLHAPIAAALQAAGCDVAVATLDQAEHGLSDAALVETDVLVWWGHVAHDEVSDTVVDRVQRRVLDGMGLVVLHSGHHSKIFRRLMGTSCNLKWREAGERERLWVVNPAHPIAEGLDEAVVIEHEEMYGEFFDIPQPDSLVFVSWFQGGEIFRSGCCYERGRGRIFYFRPGHETYPTFFQPEVLRIVANAVHWAAQPSGVQPTFGHRMPLEPV
jgi:trehalose utilization protein